MPGILICNDHRSRRIGTPAEHAEILTLSQPQREKLRIDVNEQAAFARALERHGYEVHIFDGYDEDLVTQLRDPQEGADYLWRLFENFHPEGILYDVQYWDIEDYGFQVLDLLLARGCRTVSCARSVVLTIRKNDRGSDENSIQAKYPFVLAVDQRLDFSERKILRILTGVATGHPLLLEFRQ